MKAAKKRPRYKPAKRVHWTEYKKIPYEDWKHLQSITSKDYTKGIFKETG